MNKNELISIIEKCKQSKHNLKTIKNQDVKILVESILSSKVHSQIIKELKK